jgi:hypothetical protein
VINFDSIVRIWTKGNDPAAKEYTIRFEDGTELELLESDDPEGFKKFQMLLWKMVAES